MQARVLLPYTGGHAMKLREHLPAVGIGAPDWRATIAVGTVVGALVLILTVQSGVLLTDPMLDRSSLDRDDQAHQQNPNQGVSLEVRSADPASRAWSGFSVAHALPAKVALAQRYSVGAKARVGFEAFGERALRRMSVNKRTERLRGHGHDRMMLMMMLLRLSDDRRG